MDLSDLVAKKKLLKLPTKTYVTQILREAILKGVLVEEQTLKQTDLAQELGVSHIPVREAFRELEAEGLIEVFPNRGAVVVGLKTEDVAEIYAIRCILETGALRLAVPNLTFAVLKRCELVLEEAEQTRDIHAWGDLNWEFHEILYTPGGSPRLLQMIKNLYANVDRYTRLFLQQESDRTTSLREHLGILRYLYMGNAEEAVTALEMHLAQTSSFMIERLKERDGTWKKAENQDQAMDLK